MTPNELATIALSEFNPCVISDVSMDTDRANLLKSAMLTFVQHCFPTGRITQTDPLLLEINFPVDFSDTVKVADGYGLTVRHEVDTANLKIIFLKEDVNVDLDYPINVDYLIKIDPTALNAVLPDIDLGILLDLIKVKFAQLNQRVLKTLGTFSVGQEFQGDETDWATKEDAIIERLKTQTPPLFSQVV